MSETFQPGDRIKSLIGGRWWSGVPPGVAFPAVGDVGTIVEGGSFFCTVEIDHNPEKWGFYTSELQRLPNDWENDLELL